MKTTNVFLFLAILLCSTSIQAQSDCDNDTEPPVAVCSGGIVINLEENETGYILAEVIGEHSADNCSIADLSFSADRSVPSIEVDANTVSPVNVVLYVTDGSGIQNHCWVEVYIDTQDCSNDTQVPTPYCITEATIVLDENNTATIFTSDIDAGSFDNCSSSVGLSFREHFIDPNLTFTEEGTVTVRLWVTDSNDNQNFCDTHINVLPFGSSASISGQVRTFLGEGMANVKVIAKINNTNTVAAQTTTDNQGNYTLTGLEDNETYDIEIEKDVEVLNGVSTFDMVMVRRHIVRLTPLATPFNMLAADVNDSNTITTFDMVIIRRLVLGLIDTFQDVPSWKFFRSTIQFSNPSDSYSLETITGNNFEVQLDGNNANSVDFIGIKMGDVNGSAISNF